ncbi:hypothetical protein ACFL36_01235 [Thermodesulfobacteriota bacterium]
MNSGDDMIKGDNHSNNQSSLKDQIEELERWNKFLENELVTFRRTVWKDFENLVCMAHILVKFEKVFGEDEVEKIVKDFMENEKTAAMQEQRKLAKNGDWSYEFTDIETLFSENNIGV